MSYRGFGGTTVTQGPGMCVTVTGPDPDAVARMSNTVIRPLLRQYGLGQATTVDATPLTDSTKIAIGVGAFAILGGLGYLAYKYPTPMFGGGYGMGYGYGGYGGGGRPGLMLTMNRGRRRARKRRR